MKTKPCWTALLAAGSETEVGSILVKGGSIRDRVALKLREPDGRPSPAHGDEGKGAKKVITCPLLEPMLSTHHLEPLQVPKWWTSCDLGTLPWANGFNHIRHVWKCGRNLEVGGYRTRSYHQLCMWSLWRHFISSRFNEERVDKMILKLHRALRVYNLISKYLGSLMTNSSPRSNFATVESTELNATR